MDTKNTSALDIHSREAADRPQTDCDREPGAGSTEPACSQRQRWEERYTSREDSSQRPASSFLCSLLDRLPRGRALDVACGEGRNAIFLARHGYRVEAIDIALAGLRRLRDTSFRERLPVLAVQADLEHFALPRDRYHLVLDVRYLQRSLWPSFKAAVQPGGVILFETFLSEQRHFGQPTNPEFLLEAGELLQFFQDFESLHYAEGLFDTEFGPAYLARMAARRPAVD